MERFDAFLNAMDTLERNSIKNEKKIFFHDFSVQKRRRERPFGRHLDPKSSKCSRVLTKMLYLSAQEELGAHLGHDSA